MKKQKDFQERIAWNRSIEITLIDPKTDLALCGYVQMYWALTVFKSTKKSKITYIQLTQMYLNYINKNPPNYCTKCSQKQQYLDTLNAPWWLVFLSLLSTRNLMQHVI